MKNLLIKFRVVEGGAVLQIRLEVLKRLCPWHAAPFAPNIIAGHTLLTTSGQIQGGKVKAKGFHRILEEMARDFARDERVELLGGRVDQPPNQLVNLARLVDHEGLPEEVAKWVFAQKLVVLVVPSYHALNERVAKSKGGR